MADLHTTIQRSKHNPDAVRFHVQGSVDRIHVRCTTLTWIKGIDAADFATASKIVTAVVRTDGSGRPCTYAAHQRVKLAVIAAMGEV